MQLGRLALDETDGELTISLEPNRNRFLTFLLAIWLALAAAISVAGGGILAAGGFSWPVVLVVALGLAALLSVGAYALVWNTAMCERIVVSRDAIRISQNMFGFSRTKELPAAAIKKVVSRPIWPYSSNDIDYEFLGRGLWHVEVACDRGTEKLLRRITREQAGVVASALGSKGFDATVAELRMGEVRGR